MKLNDHQKGVAWLILIIIVLSGLLLASVIESENLEKEKVKAERLLSACQKVNSETASLPSPVSELVGPGCVYNDGEGYKVIRKVHKDGAVCYGLKPYGSPNVTRFWCR